MLKRAGALVALLLSSVLLSGCIVFIGPISGEQQDIVGKLRLTFTLCASGRDDGAGTGEDHPGCPSSGNALPLTSAYGASGLEYQVLFAMRVPIGTGAPEAISATPGPPAVTAGPITVRRNASYEAALQVGHPAPAGSVWVGYLSDPYPFEDGIDDVPAQSAQVSIDLELPRNADGAPFVGPFTARPVAGARIADPGLDLPANRPVVCGANPLAINNAELTICIDSPFPGAGFNQLDYDLPFSTRDFGVLAGKATASPGQTVSLPFNVRGAGALPAGLTAGLSATTNLPGVGGVTPSVGSAALSNGSDTRVTVPVPIPKKAGPGVFDVAVTGRLDNGQTRTGVAKLTVRDRQKPVLKKLKAKPKRFKAATRRKPKRGTNVSFTLSEAASVRLTVERCAKRKRGRCVRWAALKGGLTKSGAKGANKVRFNGRLRGKALEAGGYRLVLTPRDGAANVGEAARVAFAVRR